MGAEGKWQGGPLLPLLPPLLPSAGKQRLAGLPAPAGFRGPSELLSLPPQEPTNSGVLRVSLARCVWGWEWAFSACGL